MKFCDFDRYYSASNTFVIDRTDYDELFDRAYIDNNHRIFYNDSLNIIGTQLPSIYDFNIQPDKSKYVYYQVVDSILNDSGIICRDKLDINSLKTRIKKAIYIVYATLPPSNIFEDIGQECNTAGFIFFKRFHMDDIGIFIKELSSGVIVADTLCSVDIRSPNNQSLGLGMFLFYKGIEWLKKIGYKTVIGYAASIPLVKFYMRYGFNLGVKGLELRGALEEYDRQKLDENGKLLFKEESRKAERLLRDIVYYEILNQVEDDLTTIISKQNKSEDDILEEVKILTNNIINVSEGTCMLYLDVEDNIDMMMNDNVFDFMKESIRDKWIDFILSVENEE